MTFSRSPALNSYFGDSPSPTLFSDRIEFYKSKRERLSRRVIGELVGIVVFIAGSDFKVKQCHVFASAGDSIQRALATDPKLQSHDDDRSMSCAFEYRYARAGRLWNELLQDAFGLPRDLWPPFRGFQKVAIRFL
jgi:hypothetical protein